MADHQFTPEELENEEWRKIPEFGQATPTLRFDYEVSNLGRIRTVSVRVIKTTPWGGYLRTTLYKGKQAERNGKSFGVHQLVAKMFIGPRPKGHLVNHKDTNKRNNRDSNLEYRTYQGNAQHASENGLLLTGEANPASKLTDNDVTKIIKRLVNGEPARRIARDYPVSSVVVDLIRQNRAWKHIPRPVSRYLRESKGRTHGEDSSSAKLSAADVVKMRIQHSQGRSLKALTKTFNTTKSQAWRIVTGKSWKHID
jgi:hypothetical protein